MEFKQTRIMKKFTRERERDTERDREKERGKRRGPIEDCVDLVLQTEKAKRNEMK